MFLLAQAFIAKPAYPGFTEAPSMAALVHRANASFVVYLFQ